MQVAADLALFPWGAREGLPCTVVDITGDGELPTVADVVGAVDHVSRPGVTTLWLRDVPWGSYDFDKRVAEFTYALPHMSVVTTADTTSTRWTNLQNVGWVLDVTAVVEKPVTSYELNLQTIERSHLYMPAVQEIVARKVDPSNLLHPILSALAKMWTCENGTLYITPEQERAATLAAAISGVFAVRVRR